MSEDEAEIEPTMMCADCFEDMEFFYQNSEGYAICKECFNEKLPDAKPIQ